MIKQLMLLSTIIYLKIKLTIIYYCLYSAVTYNFLLNLINYEEFPEIIRNNDKLFLLLLSIISGWIQGDKISAGIQERSQKTKNPTNNAQRSEIDKSEKLTIRKPGERIS